MGFTASARLSVVFHIQPTNYDTWVKLIYSYNEVSPAQSTETTGEQIRSWMGLRGTVKLCVTHLYENMKLY